MKDALEAIAEHPCAFAFAAYVALVALAQIASTVRPSKR